MSSHLAFRLFKVETFLKGSNKALEDDVLLSGRELIEYVEDSLSVLEKHIVREKPSFLLHPSQFEEHEPIEGDPCFLVLSYERSERLIAAVVSRGTYGELDKLVGSSTDTTQVIRDKAATTDYLVKIAFPENSNICYVAAQVRGVRNAGDELFRVISHEQHKLASRVENGEVVVKDDWYNLRATPIMDGKRLDSVLNGADVTGMTLTRRGVTNSGGRQKGKTKIAVGLTHLDDTTKFKIKQVLEKWITRRKGGVGSTPSAGASEIATAFPSGYLKPDDSWDDGKISYIENNRTKTIAERDIDRLFVYPMPDGSTLSRMWEEANLRLRNIGKADSVEIPAVD
jgi:hypothetical protein